MSTLEANSLRFGSSGLHVSRRAGLPPACSPSSHGLLSASAHVTPARSSRLQCPGHGCIAAHGPARGSTSVSRMLFFCSQALSPDRPLLQRPGVACGSQSPPQQDRNRATGQAKATMGHRLSVLLSLIIPGDNPASVSSDVPGPAPGCIFP